MNSRDYIEFRDNRVGLNIPQIELLAIWVRGMHCVIVTKLWGAQIFGVVGLNSLYDIVPTNRITPQNTYLFLCMLLRGRYRSVIVANV